MYIPTTQDELNKLGWNVFIVLNGINIILVSGDT